MKKITSTFILITSLLCSQFIWAHAGHHQKAKELSGKAQLLVDNSGLIYIGIDVDRKYLLRFLNQFNVLKGQQQYTEMRKQQQERDHGKFHVTVINPFELKEIDQTKFDFDQIFSIKLIGLGTAKNESSEAFFVVAESTEIQKLRAKLGFEQKDLHVTLGFSPEDVFGVSKGKVSLITK